jgi:pimeloyl-ACP methyl ester carboxylesterase
LGGHGKSGKNRQVWTMEAFGKDVAAVITKLDLHKVILVGHSMGGVVILETARLLPERVIGLIGAETYSDLYLQKYDRERIDLFLEDFRADFPEAVRKYVLENYFITNPEESFKKKIILDMAGTFPDVAVSSLEELMLYDGTVSLPDVKVPIRSINAETPVIPFKVMRNNYENFSLKFMTYVGHFLMLEEPQGFNRLLADYLGEIIVAFQQR